MYYCEIKENVNEQSIEQARKFAESNCQIALKYASDDTFLYRGVRNAPDVFIRDSSASVRKSRNTSNHYTLLIDNCPNWSSYPRRSRSHICTADSSKAASYGKRYVVFPAGNPHMGICPSRDMWESFDSLHDFPSSESGLWLNHINELIYALCDANHFNAQDSDESWDTLKKYLLYLSDHYRKGIMSWTKDEDYNKDLKHIFYMGDGNLLKGLWEMLDPQANNFDLKSWSEMKGILDHTVCEIWFSGPALFVSSEVFFQVFPRSNDEF